MRIEVDYDRCEASGQCALIAPEVFELSPDDRLMVHEERISSVDPTRLREAVDMCPTSALRLVED